MSHLKALGFGLLVIAGICIVAASMALLLLFARAYPYVGVPFGILTLAYALGAGNPLEDEAPKRKRRRA